MPILEGLDGVQKMSKSLGNAVGIHESPLEMYGKLMSISDQMMWRYYELLTDASMADIEKMRLDVTSGSAHPMALKKELARRIVSDFHSPDAATKAAEGWTKQFQKSEAPEELEHVSVRSADLTSDQKAGPSTNGAMPVRLDKLIYRAGLAASSSEAGRKIKEKAVSLNGQTVTAPTIELPIPTEVTLRVGKRMKRVSITT